MDLQQLIRAFNRRLPADLATMSPAAIEKARALKAMLFVCTDHNAMKNQTLRARAVSAVDDFAAALLET